MSRAQSRLSKLLGIARNAGVRVEFLGTVLEGGRSWDGLYIRQRDLGSAVGIRETLSLQDQAWVLGHELGHHFRQGQSELFSPFSFLHAVDGESRRRWGTWRRQDPEEDEANEWAAAQVICSEEWAAAESRSPCDLGRILAELDLPLVGGVVHERHRHDAQDVARSGTVRVTEEQRTILLRATRGRGGHQAFFRRVVAGLNGQRLLLCWRAFLYARVRAAQDKGGWLARYRVVLDAVAVQAGQQGGLDAVFPIDGASQQDPLALRPSAGGASAPQP